MALKLALLFLAVSAILLLSGGTYLFFARLLPAPQVAWWVKAGFAAATLGLSLLFAVVIRVWRRGQRQGPLPEAPKGDGIG